MSLEPQRIEFELILLKAQRRIINFAESHGWKALTSDSFFDCAEIYDTKESFDKALVTITDMAEHEFPKTYSAALENRVLMAVSPDIYSENYPEGIEPNSYEKLLAHEIAHRLHIRVLNGNEEAMGPIWFYEGFAIYAADQFEECTYDLRVSEIREVLASEDRGSYRKYASVFKFFAEKTPIGELIEQASKKDFSIWLSSLVSP